MLKSPLPTSIILCRGIVGGTDLITSGLFLSPEDSWSSSGAPSSAADSCCTSYCTARCQLASTKSLEERLQVVSPVLIYLFLARQRQFRVISFLEPLFILVAIKEYRQLSYSKFVLVLGILSLQLLIIIATPRLRMAIL